MVFCPALYLLAEARHAYLLAGGGPAGFCAVGQYFKYAVYPTRTVTPAAMPADTRSIVV